VEPFVETPTSVRKKFWRRNGVYWWVFDVLEDLQTHRQILFDFTANYLEPLHGVFQRLAYLSSLRESKSGRYLHDRLEAVYGSERVNLVLGRCHEEIFERLLEMPLTSQEEDLRQQLSAMPGSFADNAKRAQESGRAWIPPEAPSYLKELFGSNLNVLSQLLLDSMKIARSDS
jgi:hypothetical protein